MKMLIALLLLPFVANAEPGPTTQYLMTEPATLFDVGMVRLDILTTEFEKRVGLSWANNAGSREFFEAEVNSHYDRNDDRIYVSFLIMNSEATYPQMEEGCGVAMSQMGIWLGKSLPDLFLPFRPDTSAEAVNRSSALRELFVMRCHVSSARDTSEGRFWASRSLSDRAMTIGRWDVSN
jgi:hypothetical protein